jgi:hypothetical protein
LILLLRSAISEFYVNVILQIFELFEELGLLTHQSIRGTVEAPARTLDDFDEVVCPVGVNESAPKPLFQTASTV